MGLASNPRGAPMRILPKKPAGMPDLKAFTSSFQALAFPHLGHFDGMLMVD
jgi:hypothetical protein